MRGELDRGRGGSAAACCVLCLCISSYEPASEEEKRGVGGFAGAERRVEPENWYPMIWVPGNSGSGSDFPD